MLSYRRQAFCLFFLMQGLTAWAVSPEYQWLTFKTPHFHVHHTQKQRAFAEKFSSALELAMPVLTKDLAWKPENPIDIVVNDESDSTNGFAFSLPSNRIEVYTVPFPTESSLADYHDWVQELAIHELTHIIANDTGFGGYRFLRSIFGSIIKPNGLQPVWLVEGLAVYQETALTVGGRGRSLLTEAILRRATRDRLLDSDQYIQLSRFNDGVFWWPAGHTPYLLGYTIQAGAQGRSKELSAEAPQHNTLEQSVPGKVSTTSAGNLPFRPQRNLQEVLGEDWDKTWESTSKKLSLRYGTTNGKNPAFCQLSQGGRFTGGASLSKDGWIYFTYEHPDHGPTLARTPSLAQCGKNSVEVLVERPGGSPSQVSVSPSGSLVAFANLSTHREYFSFTDLHLYDVREKSTKQLTFGLRAFDPSFGDENTIYFIRNLGDSRQALSWLSLSQPQKVYDLYIGEAFERLSHPFIGKASIYFARHNNRGQEDILVIDRSGLKARPMLTKSFSTYSEQDPFEDTSGNVFFTASYPQKDGTNTFTRDIYVLEKGARQPKLFVQSPSGFSTKPIVLGESLWISDYGLKGFDLTRIDLTQESFLIANLPKHDLPLHEFLSKDSNTPMSSAPEGNLSASEGYSVWKSPAASIWPKYWIPLMEFVPDGYTIGAGTTGLDPLRKHSYGIDALYDSRADFPLIDASYQNRVWPVGWNVFGIQRNSYFQSSSQSNRYSLGAIEAVLPSNPWIFRLGIAYQERQYYSALNKSPFAFTNFEYSSAKKVPSALFANKGVSFASYLAFYPESDREIAFWDWRPALSLYLPGLAASHSFSQSFRAGITTNRFLASNYYVGGGLDSLSDNDFIVRGYPSDTLFGQKIATYNLAYTLPLARPYSGWGTNPFFFRDWGLRILADAGSAKFLSRYNGKSFLGFESLSLGKRVLVSAGAELIFNNTILYYVPLQISVGLHHGFQKKYGGASSLYFALNVNIPGLTVQPPTKVSE